jgi:RNA polymerase sigma-70 factor (ECF subfamily)
MGVEDEEREERERRRWEERGLRDGALSGDEGAWRVLFDRHFAKLYRYVYYRAGKDRQRADDVVQECWRVAVEAIRRFDPERAPFDAWLRGIAANVLRNERRRGVALGDQLNQPPRVDDVSVNRLAEDDLIAAALGMLPDHYRAALRSKYVVGLSVAEIAVEQNVSEKSIESILSRARAAFKEAYRALEES